MRIRNSRFCKSFASFDAMKPQVFSIVSGTDKRLEAARVEASPQWLTNLATSF